MSEGVNVLGIAGSLREASLNRALLRAQPLNLPHRACASISSIWRPSPLYNGDVEAAGRSAECNRVQTRHNRGGRHPHGGTEYNHGRPGVMKNAVDWASRPPRGAPLNAKSVGIIGASPGAAGSARGQSQLHQAVGSTNSYAMPQPEILVFRAHEKFDAQGRLTDKATGIYLARYLEAFLVWVRRFDVHSTVN